MPWAGGDTDAASNPLGSGENAYVVLATVDVSAYAGTNGQISLYLASHGTNYESSDRILIQTAYDTDIATGANTIGGLPTQADVGTGTYTTIAGFRGTTIGSVNLQQDTDLDGVGDGVALSPAFSQHIFSHQHSRIGEPVVSTYRNGREYF